MRKSYSEQAAASHRQLIEASRKQVPPMDLNERVGNQGLGVNLITSNQISDRDAYRQFRHWTFVAISAIARRLSGFQMCAGQLVNPQPMDLLQRTKWRKSARGNYRRRALKPAEVQKVPRSILTRAPSAELELIDNHPVLALLNRPNSVQSKYEMIFTAVASLLLTGESYFIGGTGPNGTTVWAIPSTWVDAKHFGGLFTGYTLRADGAFADFEVPDGAIARMYCPDPSDPKKVLSPYQANSLAAKTDESLQKAHKTSFDHGIFPKMALQIGRNVDAAGNQVAHRPILSAEERESLQRAVLSLWMRESGDDMPGILDGLIEDVKVLQSTPQEMDYLNSSKVIKERVFQAYGLNPIIVGEITASNKAQALVAERSFNRNVLAPLADQISVCLTDWLDPWFDPPKNLVVYLAKEEPSDEDLVVKKWQHAVDNKLVSVDRYRTEVLQVDVMDDDERSQIRSKMLDNPQAMSTVMLLSQQVGAGKVKYEAAVKQIETFLSVDEATAKGMLGPEPTDEEIEANRPQPPIPPAPPAADDDSDDDQTPPPADDDEEDEGDEVDDEESKKKTLKQMQQIWMSGLNAGGS